MFLTPAARKRRLAEQAARLASAVVLARGQDNPAFADDVAACRSLSGFIARAWDVIEPGTEYLSNYHIGAMCEYLEAVSSGQIRRLLINIPPRYMKSITVSVMWPIWEWTSAPHRRFMFATYAQTLSDEHSYRRRLILNSDWFRERWPSVRILKETIATVSNTSQGEMIATSFSGTATGKGANRLVIDDPHNPKQAESETERKTARVLFDTTFQSRLNDKKRDAIVCVMQRLHEEDIAARCIELGYTHLCLPAESEGRTVISLPSGREIVREDGEPLWPEREGPAELQVVRESMGSYGYAGQYQQRPAPSGGGMFTSFPVVDVIPDGCEWVRYWDKAGTEGGGAYSAGCKMARSPDGRYFVTSMVRGQWSAANRERVISDTASSDGPLVHIWTEQEPGSGGKESAENTVKMLAGYVAKKETVTGDKVSRARPMAAQAEIGNVYLLRGPWNDAFVQEARVFPVGKYKDQIDAASGAFNKLALCPRPQKGHAEPAEKPAPINRNPGHGFAVPDVMADPTPLHDYRIG